MYLEVPSVEVAHELIRAMAVRGAPAIAIAGALARAAELRRPAGAAAFAALPGAEAAARVRAKLEHLVTARPTAVNLSEACGRLARAAEGAAAEGGAAVAEAVAGLAEAMLGEDLAANRRMGAAGADAVAHAVAGRRGAERAGRLRVLTHCNTGSLATAGYGTALGVVRALHERGVLERAYCTETRPYGQGARLTAYELVHERIPATLIADSAAAALMVAGGLDAVVVGADRIANNGDTANKIGTLALAIAAAHAGVPFFIAAPTTTIDFGLSDGSGIVIEERSGAELTHNRDGSRAVVEGIDTWNPAFCVAPAALITGIVTELGVFHKADGAAGYDLTAAVTAQRGAVTAPLPTLPAGFFALDEKLIPPYLRGMPDVVAEVGGAPEEWDIKEVGDGNINFVYIVRGPRGAVVLKQSLPYVRCVGESWPLTSDRAKFEAQALLKEGELCPEHVPKVFKYDATLAVIVMQYLAPPHIILRKGLVQGVQYPRLADQMSSFLAQTLFHTSLLALDTTTYRANVAEYAGNNEMCRLTEQVIFTEPYGEAANNRHTSPQLDADVAGLRGDVAAKRAIAQLKHKFCEHAQALIHGDLHTGSMMVTQDTCFVIDPEFCFYRPMGFDVGAFLANLFLAYFAMDGHGGDRAAQKAWLLETVTSLWNLFAAKFAAEWTKAAAGAPGDACPPLVFGAGAAQGAEALAAYQAAYLRDLLGDALGFAGAKMIRRVVGIAHVEDLDSIPDPDVRAGCERRALHFGRRLLVEGAKAASIEAVVTKVDEWSRAA